MQLQVCARSHIGKVRSKNEDNLCFFETILPEKKEQNYVLTRSVCVDRPVFLGVFDGMGGYSGGERASVIMARLASQIWKENAGKLSANELMLAICEDANLAVCQEMRNDEGMRMGTTASMLCFEKKKYTLCNIGDSPIFRFRDGVLTQEHQEHTERATYESVTGQKADPKRKFRLTQNIGLFPDEISIEPYCTEGNLLPGDIYLICSDGITDMVDPNQIAEILKTEKTVDAMAERLEQQAQEAGGKDNATVICIMVLEESGLRKLWNQLTGR